MQLLSLDLATRLGFAHGDSVTADKPVAGWHQLPATGEDIGRFALAYHDWLRAIVADVRPDMIVFEEPMPDQAGRTPITTSLKLKGLCWHTEFYCKVKGIRCAQVHASTWKKAFTGSARASKSQKPYPVVTSCRQRGWDIIDDNAADAAGIWYHACTLVSAEAAVRHDPLFRAAARQEAMA